MWNYFIIKLLACAICTNYVEATYNTGIKTRVYEQQQPLNQNYNQHHHHHQHSHHHHSHHQQPQSVTQAHYSHQYSDTGNDKDYQSPITHHHIRTDNTNQPQQPHESDYHQPAPKVAEQPAQLPQQPIYERRGNSQTQPNTANWPNSDSSTTKYYVGCPPGHTGPLPYAYDCRRFLNCWHGRDYIQLCSVGTVFNPESLECDRPDKVECGAALGSMLGAKAPTHGSTKQPQYRAGRYTDASDDNVEVLCPIGAEGLQPHPSDCTRFINCANGNMHIQQCGPGTAYSIPMKVCDFKHKVDCSGREGDAPSRDTQTSVRATPPAPLSPPHDAHPQEDLPHTADIMCLKDITGLFPYPFDYTKFINCQRGNTAIQNCVPNTAFSISKGYCEPLNEIQKSDHVMYIVSEVSYEYSQTVISCPPGTEGLHLYPFNAQLFINCVKSQMKVLPCTNAYVFSVSRRTCLPSEQVLKKDRVRLLSELVPAGNYRLTDENYNLNNMVYCPGFMPGNFPHPFDSTKYLKCVQGRLISESCASGQAFSLSRKICSLKEEMYDSDYVSQARPTTNGQDYHVTNIEVTHGAVDGLTYLMCPPGLSGHYLHPFDCTKYIECKPAGTAVDKCTNGAVFSISHKKCLPRDRVEAYDRVEYLTTTSNEFNTNPKEQNYQDFTITCNPGTFGLYPFGNERHKYIRCADGRALLERCPSGQIFNITQRTCHNENEMGSSDRSTYNRGLSTINTVSNNGDPKLYPYPNPNPTTSQATENRWTNMNIPRPQGPTYNYDQSTPWQQTPNSRDRQPLNSNPAWPGTYHVDQHNPAHTVHEEESYEPNRNYNRRMYTTPLAPLKPTTTTTTAASTVVYAQPVGSQEDSKEIFSPAGQPPSNAFNPPPYFPTSNRQNHTRQINPWTPIRPVDVPRHESNPAYPGPLYTNSHAPVPSASYPVPSLQNLQPSWAANRPQVQVPAVHLSPPYANEDSGQKPVLEAEFKTDPIPGQLTYDLNDFDQLPSPSTKHNSNDNNNNNLYRGLQPPPDRTLTTTTARNLSPSFYEQTTQLSPPLRPTTPTHRIRHYPQLSNATIQTFPHQPHYSPPYAEVAHSRNASWVGRKIPQYSAIKPIHKNPITYENFYNRKTATSVPQNNNEDEGDEPAAGDQEAVMKEALKLLLKPYLDTDSAVDNNMAEKAQSHIMNLVSNSDQLSSTTTTTTTTTVIPHTTFLNKNTLVPSTTPHQEDVELILAGEQHDLVGLTHTQAGNHEPSSSSNLYHTSLEPVRSTYNHEHHNNWHNNHHNPHNFKLQHSREFHKKHPNLPNPFNDPIDSYNPQAESTTQRTYDFDIRVAGQKCALECGNGKCVEQHQICDGVNDCGNRRDEQECEHLGYELRLTGGQSSNMGRVEVKILGRWGYVCDDKFGLRDADVVCHELGFKMGAMEVRGNSYYAPTDVDIHFAMDEVACSGNETSLKDCDFKGWGVSNCGPDEVVGVVCKIPKLKCPDNYWLCSTSKECIPTAFLCDVTPDCEDGSDESVEVCNAPIQYRLEGGRSSNEGRLEVFYRGEWGTVCDDDFGLKEAQVACNSFGLYGKSQIVKNIYGPGSGPIWLDQVSCLGNESHIDECNHWSWGENNCNHTEDVGIKCVAGPKPSNLKAKHPSTVDASTQNLDLESTLQFEQSELDDLGLYQGLWQRSSKAIHTQKKCGHFKSNLIDEYEHPEERVINGTIAKRGRHPWQATIRTRGRGGISSHWCGAVIISRKLILTAAHCLAGYPKGSYFVRMGDHYANIAESSEIDSNIENWYIHEKFRDQKHMNNDIALILLKTPVHFNDYVQPVCLPEKGATLENNRMCTISGWGSIKSGTSTPSNILRSAQVPILADEVCSQKNVYANAMSEGMFCAGFLDESADACDGDSGGPLVCSDEDGETLYGIISWGQHCGYANHPGVYVRVEKYIDWIYEKINLMLQQGKL